MLYGWTLDEIADMTPRQIVIASHTERKYGEGQRSKSGNRGMVPIRNHADIQALLGRQEMRRAGMT